MNNPLISILIPVYNGSAFLKATLESILASTERDFEVIFVDDMSTDDSVEILRRYAENDPRIRIICRESKGGNASKGITYGLPFCRGRFFFYMSQDDLLSPDCLEKCVRTAQETGAEAVVPDMAWYYGDDGQDHGSLSAPDGDYGKILTPMESFIATVRYQMGGFSMREMELVRRVGYDDTYFDSCDFSVARQHFYANKTARCSGIFYYRQNNADAITKSISPTSYTSMYTYNQTLEFMEAHHFPTAEIKRVARSILSRRKNLVKRLPEVAPEKQAQAKRIVTDTLRVFRRILRRNKLIILWLKTFRRYGKNKSRSWKRLFYHKKIKDGREITRFLCFTFRGKKRPYFTKEGIFVPATPNIRHVGKHTYCGSDLVVINREQTVIGSFVSIGNGVQLGNGEHPTDFLTTSPYLYFDFLGFKSSDMPTHNEYTVQKPITIGSDAWIGDGAYVMNGVTIGIGAIVGARSVVTKDVPPYAIAVGAPAKIIRYRFDPDTIARLLASEWWNLPDDTIRKIPYDSPQQALDFLQNLS